MRMNIFKRNDTGEWYTFYPNHESYRTRGSEYPLPENADSLDPGHKITGGILHYDSYRNGGEWLDAVHPTGYDGVVTGFIHAEDQFWNGQTHLGPFAFKSISLGGCRHGLLSRILCSVFQRVALTTAGAGHGRVRC